MNSLGTFSNVIFLYTPTIWGTKQLYKVINFVGYFFNYGISFCLPVPLDLLQEDTQEVP